jgi:hypothetical protein
VGLEAVDREKGKTMLGSIKTIQAVIARCSSDCHDAKSTIMTDRGQHFVRAQIAACGNCNAHAMLSVLTMWIRMWLINSVLTDWQIDQPAQPSAINPERMEP